MTYQFPEAPGALYGSGGFVRPSVAWMAGYHPGFATDWPARGIMRLDDWWWDDFGQPSDSPSNVLEPAFGQDAGGGQAAGGGGAGGADAVGGILQAVAAIVNGVFEGVATAKAVEAQPQTVAQTQTRMFTRRLQAIDRLRDEIAQEEGKVRDARLWLKDSSRKKQWRTGSLAMSRAPRHATWCDVSQDERGRYQSPGGHAYGVPSCRCPTADCAYKDPLGARAQRDKIKAALAKIERIRDTRDGGNIDWPRTWGHGNLRAYRTELQHSWSLLMGLRAFEPLLKMAPEGVAVLSKTPSANLLIGAESLEKVFPDDPDAQRGVVPFHVLNEHLGSWLNFATLFPVMDGFRPPIWLYGLSEAEQRQIGVGPTIGAIKRLLAARDAGQAIPGFSGYGYDGGFGSGYDSDAVFGAAPTGGIAGMVKAMLLSPQGQQILQGADAQAAAANPASTQIANSPQAQAPAPSEHINTAPGPTYPRWMPWAIGGGLVLGLGFLGLLWWLL